MSCRIRDQRGFVLSVVIFAVAALSIAGTALFLVVQSESAMANSGAESSSALHLANAGLARYMGETIGQPRAEVTYSMGGGSVTVRATRIQASGDTSVLYIVRAEATIADRRISGLVSRRSVQQYAHLRLRPFRPVASIGIASAGARARNVVVDGRDQCGAAASVAGIRTLEDPDLAGTIAGSPATATSSFAQYLEDVGVDWATLRDPTVPFEYEVPRQAWPPFLLGRVAADEYPTIRVTGDLPARATLSGRGLLVVTGDITFYDGFTWDGAIIAGGIDGNAALFTVNGTLLTGFNGAQNNISMQNGTVRYNSCMVASAAAGISMFTPLANTWWETSD